MNTTSVSVGQLLMLYGWFVLAALMLILGLIARFYARFSGERTGYPFLLIPLGLYGIAAVRYASVDRIAGDPLGDLATAFAGLIFLILCVRLYRQMVLQRQQAIDE
ncbi:MAG: hypothetical protein KJ065_14795 [Anaerolineae bacterium]|nr:hypothetical protein [Anaerolineae bacterium]